MKKIIICMMLFAFATTSFSQGTTRKPTLTQTDYLKKSKNQKKTAWLFLGGGAAILVAGALIPEGEETGEINWACLCKVHKNDEIKGVFIFAGGVTMLGSIPFFITSGKNKRRAKEASVFINMEKASVLQKFSIRQRPFPSVGISIRL